MKPTKYNFKEIPSHYENFCDKEAVIACDWYNHKECPRTCNLFKKEKGIEKIVKKI